MARINLDGGGVDLKGDALGALFARLVDETGNPIGKAQGDTLAVSHDGIPFVGVNDNNYRLLRVDRMGNVGQAGVVPLFDAVFDGTTINAAQLASTNATQTTTQATGSGLALNAGASVAANGSSVALSLRKFSARARGPLIQRTRARFIKGGVNGVAEFGFGDPATNVALPIGAAWQFDAAGILKPILVYNGTTVSGSDVASLIDSTRYYWWDIIVSDDRVTFAVQDPATGLILSEQSLNIGSDAGRMFSVSRLGAFARTYVGATIATAPATQLFIGQMFVGAYDTSLAVPAEIAMASMGLAGDRNPLTGVQTAQQANSAAAASATLSNVAAGYTAIGGRFQFAAPAGAETDFALFGYQVPTGYQLTVKGVSIDTINTGAAVATTATVLEWDIGTATAVSLATAGPIRRGGIGFQSFPIGSAVGVQATPIREKLTTPFIVESGRFFHVILRVPIGTATASQIIRGQVAIDAHWSH